MAPQAQDFYDLFCFQNLIDEAMLDVDTSGIGPGQIANQLLVGWGILVGVLAENFQQFLGFGS